MVDSNSIISKVLKNFQENNSTLLEETKMDEDISQKHYSGLYVFISFDLVNSTRYKSIEQNWPNLINYFYDTVASELRQYESTKLFNVWKYIGDEVLFFGKVMDAEYLVEIPQDVMKTLKTTTKHIFEKFEESKGLLGLKATVWCAEISEFGKNVDAKKRKNYLLEKTNSNSYDVSSELPTTVYDFLGPDIDAGFRLAKQCARKNQVVVSAELTFLILSKISSLNEENQILGFKKYRIMDLVPLKGIWHERQYPVIWYREQWDKGVFEYDQTDEEYTFYKQNYQVSKEPGFDIYSYLSYIMNSVGKAEIVAKYSNSITNSSKDELATLHRLAIEYPVEIHLVAIIFNQDGQVFIMKRDHKKNHPGRFDFGCVNLRYRKSIKESLIDYYTKLLGIDKCELNILEDSSGNPIPISTYSYTKRKGDTVSGLIFTAKIETDVQINTQILEKYEYSDYQFQNVDGLELKNIDMYENSIANILKSKKMIDSN